MRLARPVTAFCSSRYGGAAAGADDAVDALLAQDAPRRRGRAQHPERQRQLGAAGGRQLHAVDVRQLTAQHLALDVAAFGDEQRAVARRLHGAGQHHRRHQVAAGAATDETDALHHEVTSWAA